MVISENPWDSHMLPCIQRNGTVLNCLNLGLSREKYIICLIHIVNVIEMVSTNSTSPEKGEYFLQYI